MESAPKRIVIIEDESAHFELIRHVLAKDYPGAEIVWFRMGDEFLRREDWTCDDILIVDYMIPGLNGIQIIERLRERGLEIPTIFTTGHGSEEIAVQAMKLGAYDYVVKTTESLRTLPKIVRRAVKENRWKAEAKRAQQALAESEERYRTVFNTAPDSIFVKDISLAYTQANKAMERLGGKPVEEIIGKRNDDVFGGETAKRFQEDDVRVLRGETVERESQIPIDGEPRLFHIVKAPIRDDKGEVTGLCGIARDITERQRQEEELAKLRNLESLGVLAGGIAHDFNNLLTSILGNAEYAGSLEKDEDQELREAMEHIVKTCLSARSLTRQLLTFAKGGAPIVESGSLAELLRETTEFLMRGSDIGCELNIEEGLIDVVMDAPQISQAVRNLVSNALQATPEGGTIVVRAMTVLIDKDSTVSLSPGKYAAVEVRDAGAGIPPEILPRIFDPYFSTRARGSGLGLPTALSIVRRHGGQLTVNSVEGKGSTFTFYLPAPNESDAAAENSESGALSGLRILVMDDDARIRDVLDRLLKSEGHDVETARNGAEAVEIFESALDGGRRFDVAILDLTIPGGMGGRDVVKRFKELDPGVKAIVASGYYADPVMSNYSAHGFSDVVCKPYVFKDLKESIRRVTRAE